MHDDPSVEAGSHQSTGSGDVAAMHESFVWALAGQGVLGKLRAQLRAAAVGIVRGDAARATGGMNPNPPPSQLTESQRLAVFLVNDLLGSMQYSAAQGVFEEEASLRDVDVPRGALASTLGLEAEPSSGPLLVQLVDAVTNGVLSEAPESTSTSPARSASSAAPTASHETSPASAPRQDRLVEEEPEIPEEEDYEEPVSQQTSAPQQQAIPEPVSVAPTTTTAAPAAAPAADTSAAPQLEDSIAFSDITDSMSLVEDGEQCDLVDEHTSLQKNSSPSSVPTTAASSVSQPAAAAAPVPAAVAPVATPVVAAPVPTAAPTANDDDDVYSSYEDSDEF